MARKKKQGSSAEAEAETNEVVETEEVSAEPAAPSHDAAASERVIAACANLSSLCVTAVETGTAASSPFLSFAQRTRIRALATNFESGGGVRVIRESAAPLLTGGGGTGDISRAEIDAIIEHRVQIAVADALQRLGAAPGLSLDGQIDKAVQGQVSAQENRILDYVRTQLTDSLGVFETRMDARIGELRDAQSTAAVDTQLEEARENLLKDIDEVRTVDVGVDAFAFAAGIVEVDGTGSSPVASEDVVVAAGEEIEIGDGEEIEIGDGEEIEVGDGEAVEIGDGEEIEVGDGEEIASAEVEEIEGAEVEVSDEEDETAAVEIDDGPIEIAGEVLDEIVIGDDAIEDLQEIDVSGAADAVGEASIEMDLSEIEDLEVVTGEADGESAEMVTMEIDGGEELEEISVIQPMPDEAFAEADSLELDTASVALEEVDLDEDLSLMTLGDGPDEIKIDGADEEAETESESEMDIDIEIDIEEPDDGDEEEGGKDAMIARYMDRALQMGARQQFTPALELYSKVLDLDDAHFDALVSRGVLHSKTKDYRKATEDFRRAQEIAPERAGSYYGLAELHYNRRQFNKAIKNYNLAIERDDQLAEAYCRRGLSYYYLKNYKVAFHDLYKAYDINPDLPKIRSFLKLVQNKIKESEG